jgi:ferritin-like metal-binding protein YciE
MNDGRQRIIEALTEAHTSEQTHEQVLQAQIAAAPRGRYRKGLQTHLRETRDHTRRLEHRMSELRQPGNVFQLGIKLFESTVGQSVAIGMAPLALGRAPLNLLGKSPLNPFRGSGGPAKVLDDAKAACAAEALEIARYRGIEGLAQSLGDRQTARLVASIRADEEKMLAHLVEEIPSLVTWVVEADARGKAAPTIPQRRANGRTRSSGRKPRKSASPSNEAKRPVRRARIASPAAPAASQATDVAAPPRPDLPIASYETLSVEEIVDRLGSLSFPELARIDEHERQHESRSAILGRISLLRGDSSPVDEELKITAASATRPQDREQPAPLRSYHDMGETRESILAAAEKELTGA